MRCAIAGALLLASASTWGACDPLPGGAWRDDCARLTWTYPTRNTDGSALTDLASFGVYRRCDAGALTLLATVPSSTSAPAGGESSTFDDEAPPIPGTCWYSVTARNAVGEESVRTGEVSKTFAAELAAPGAVAATYSWTSAPVTVGARVVTDNFNRANGGLGSNWSSVSSYNRWAVNSNQAGMGWGNGISADRYTGATFDGDQYAKATVKAVPTGSNRNGVGVRFQSSGDSNYRVALHSGGTELWKTVAGTATQLGSTAAAVSVSDTVEIRATGVVISVLVNDVAVIAVVDSEISGGTPGLIGYDAGSGAAMLDDWEGGDVTGIRVVNVAKSNVDASSATLTATFPIATTAANTIVGMLAYSDSDSTTDVSSMTDTHAMLDGFTEHSYRAESFICENIGGGDTSWSVTLAGAKSYRVLYLIEVAGVPTSGVLDDNVYQHVDSWGATTDAASSGNMTTTVDGALVLGFVIQITNANLHTAGTGFVRLDTQVNAGGNSQAIESKVQTSAGSIAATWTPPGANLYTWVFGVALKPDAGGVGATVSRAAESDTAQTIARSKSKATGQAAETDLAQAAARYKSRVAALVAETDAAQAVAKAKARSTPQAAESDQARTITPGGAPLGGTVTQAAETDSARGLSSAKAKSIGQAAELDLVQTILRVKARAVGQALEGDSARPISLPGSIGGTLSQAIESDLARSVGKAKAKAIAQALETDAGRAIAATRAYAVGRASETDAAIAVAAIGKALALGVATEQDIARAFTVSGGAPVDFYYLREALEMAAASIIAALANTTVTVDVGGAGETSGVVAIQQERSFDPGLPGLRMASTSTEFLLEKKTAPASLKQGTLIRDETSSETYRVRRLNYNRGGIVTVEIERV